MRRGGRRASSTDVQRLLGGLLDLELCTQLAQARLGARDLVEIAALGFDGDLELVHRRGQVALAEIRLGERAMLRDGAAEMVVGARLDVVEVPILRQRAQALV